MHQHAPGGQQLRVRRPPEEYDDQYPPRLPTSSIRRYTHADPYLVAPQLIAPPRRGVRRPTLWYLLVVLSSITIGITLTVLIPQVWQRWRDDSTYGYPRTYQTSAMVGHGDPHSPMSHFVALNLGGLLEVIELPGGDPAKYPPRLYRLVTLTGDGADLVPVTVRFADINGDGRPDLIATYGGTEMILFNDGKGFVSRL
jgi:hypothetical protein